MAELICRHVPGIEAVQFLNSGSEATALAIHLARAATRRNHIIVMQGGYNGWHNDVSCNLMTPLELLGPRRSPGEYPYHSMSAGVPDEHRRLVHPINFNDLVSVEYVCERRSFVRPVFRLGSHSNLPPSCTFMDHLPEDWHDLAEHHNSATDSKLRLRLIERGIYVLPAL